MSCTQRIVVSMQLSSQTDRVLTVLGRDVGDIGVS